MSARATHWGLSLFQNIPRSLCSVQLEAWTGRVQFEAGTGTPWPLRENVLRVICKNSSTEDVKYEQMLRRAEKTFECPFQIRFHSVQYAEFNEDM